VFFPPRDISTELFVAGLFTLSLSNAMSILLIDPGWALTHIPLSILILFVAESFVTPILTVRTRLAVKRNVPRTCTRKAFLQSITAFTLICGIQFAIFFPLALSTHLFAGIVYYGLWFVAAGVLSIFLFLSIPMFVRERNLHRRKIQRPQT
jgi:hypothetical protein